jgi:polar amino acid transport system substrate-binding protein
MKTITMLLSLLLIFTLTHAEEKVLRADFRQRPPEMVIESKNRSGPLKDIIEEAAHQLGYKIKWRNTPFPRSLNDLKEGNIDILPKTMRTEQREKFVNYLGPIGYQDKDILFLVKKGQEDRINRYEDLKGLKIAVKRKTAYFKRFNEDTTLNKREHQDDDNMVKMFELGRFDTMIILDQASLEKAMAKHNITNFSYANYKYIQRIGNYYGMSKESPHAEIYHQLNEILLDMAKSGEITKIYRRYGIKPPFQD